MASIFTRIINGEIPSYKIAENDRYIAILDAFPLVKGHVLVISKQEVDKLFELDKETYSGTIQVGLKNNENDTFIDVLLANNKVGDAGITLNGEVGSIRFWCLKLGVSRYTAKEIYRNLGIDHLILWFSYALKGSTLSYKDFKRTLLERE